MSDVSFIEGNTYHNELGRYEVLLLNGPTMRVRYESGEEVLATSTNGTVWDPIVQVGGGCLVSSLRAVL